MIRAILVVVFVCTLIAVPAAAVDTEFNALYLPEGQVVAGQEVTVFQNIFVGERFWNGYTLEFNTDLKNPVWRIALMVQNRTTQTWELPYEHATISGFTISTAERDTWLVTSLTGTPSPYDEGTEITLWQMKVKMANDATTETFIAKPVKVEPAPTTAVTTVPETTITTVPDTTKTMTTAAPQTPPATPQSSFEGCVFGLAACLGVLLLWRR